MTIVIKYCPNCKKETVWYVYVYTNGSKKIVCKECNKEG